MSVFGVIWIGLAAAGAGVTALGLREALRDRAALRRAGIDGNHRLLAAQTVRHAVSNLVEYALLAGFILWAVVRDEPDHESHVRYVACRNAAATAVCLIAALNALKDLHERRRIMRSLDRDLA